MAPFSFLSLGKCTLLAFFPSFPLESRSLHHYHTPLHHRFAPTAPKGVPAETHLYTVTDIFDHIMSHNMSVPQIIERTFAYFDVPKTERDFLLSNVQQWAATEGHTSILVELGKLELTEPIPDPIADIPLVNPVQTKDMGSFPVRTFPF